MLLYIVYLHVISARLSADGLTLIFSILVSMVSKGHHDPTGPRNTRAVSVIWVTSALGGCSWCLRLNPSAASHPVRLWL